MVEAIAAVLAFFTNRNRNWELVVLLSVAALAVMGPAAVALAEGARDLGPAYRLATLTLAPIAALHLIMRLAGRRGDAALLPAAGALSALGVAFIYRLTPKLVEAQITWILIGVIAGGLVVLAGDRYRALQRYKYLIGSAGLVLLILPALIGREHFGAKLWLSIGGVSFQPSEIAKLLMVLFLAAYLDEKGALLGDFSKRVGPFRLPRFKYLGPLLLMWAISLMVLVFEKDLGSSLLFFGVFLSMVYVATGRLFYTNLGGILFLSGAAMCYRLFAHVRTRVDIWLHPFSDVTGKSYQIAQSLFAIASGGLTGAGLALGFPTRIPAVQTDFVFSAIAEELGLVGATAVLAVYLIFTYHGFRVALRARDDFSRLLATGLTATFALQTVVILGGVTRLVPLTGVTLPFMSYGGSSILANFILLGMLLAISHETESHESRGAGAGAGASAGGSTGARRPSGRSR